MNKRAHLSAAVERTLVVATIVLLGGVAISNGQELEPRSYSPSPVGTTFVIAGFGRSQGPILMDPTLDVDNVRGDLWIATPGLGYVFDLAGRQARILAIAPIGWGSITGELHGKLERQDLTGLVDPRFKLSVGLRNARGYIRRNLHAQSAAAPCSAPASPSCRHWVSTNRPSS